MKFILFRILLVTILSWSSIVWASERVSFLSDGITLSSILYRPVGRGPFPAIVALHGCGGFDGPASSPKFRDSDWAKRLVNQGFIVLLPDSFGSRGVGAQCGKNPRVRHNVERTADAFAAKRYLQNRPDVKKDQISIMGWSNGGSTVIYVINGRAPKRSLPDYERAVAFYPNCRALAKIGFYHPRIPLLILIGDSDKAMSVTACRTIVKQAESTHYQAEIIVYPGVGHSFDQPNLSPLANQLARADVLKRVPIFLSH